MNIYKNLSTQDKKTLQTGSVIVAIIIFLFFVIMPLKDKENSYKSQITREEKTAEEVASMTRRYAELKKNLEGLKKSARNENSDFTLFSFLDEAASASKLKEHIKAMKPSIQPRDEYTESTVVVELEDVAIDELTKYLHIIESSDYNLRINKADIKPRYSNPESLAVTLHISYIEII